VACPNVGKPEPGFGFVDLASKESDVFAKAPDHEFTKTEPFSFGSIYDIDAETPKAIISIEAIPLE